MQTLKFRPLLAFSQSSCCSCGTDSKRAAFAIDVDALVNMKNSVWEICSVSETTGAAAKTEDFAGNIATAGNYRCFTINVPYINLREVINFADPKVQGMLLISLLVMLSLALLYEFACRCPCRRRRNRSRQSRCS